MTVLLFRSEPCTTDSEQDPYISRLSRSGFSSISVPVLSAQMINLDKLESIIQNDIASYGGLIATSKKASSAFSQVFQKIDDPGMTSVLLFGPCSFIRKSIGKISAIKSLPFFTVGQSTALPLIKCSINPLGLSSHTAQVLSQQIIDHHTHDPIRYPLLFLTGDKTRDVLPTQLEGASIPFVRLMVYQTCPNPHFMKSIPMDPQFHPAALVFFSPSGVAVTWQYIREKGWLHERLKIIAIGPTTAKHLQSLGVTTIRVCENPDAESVVRALQMG